jgi:hypothetical protein
MKPKIRKLTDISKRNTDASKNVEERDKTFKTGKIITGDKNWPKNQNVVSFPISFPLICGGASFITHILVFGIIMPIPNPDNIMAITTNTKVWETAMQTNPAAISKYPTEKIDRKLSRLFILEYEKEETAEHAVLVAIAAPINAFFSTPKAFR